MEIKKSEKVVPSKFKFADSDEEDQSEEEHQSEDDDSQGKVDDQSSSEEEEDLEVEIKRMLADVPLGELHQERSNGFQAVYKRNKGETKVKRKNKNRPMEMSSKKPVGRFREVIQGPKKVRRDPRYESLCGDLDNDGFRFRKIFDFSFESKLLAQNEELQKLMKKSKDPKVTADLKGQITSIDKQLKAGSAKRIDAHILSNHKKREREAAKQGKRPYYLKTSDLRQQRLIEQYNHLKAAGELDSFMRKRRKKNATKDRRFMPYRRPGNDDQPE